MSSIFDSPDKLWNSVCVLNSKTGYCMYHLGDSLYGFVEYKWIFFKRIYCTACWLNDWMMVEVIRTHGR